MPEQITEQVKSRFGFLMFGGELMNILSHSEVVSMGVATGNGARLRLRSEKPDVSLLPGIEVIPEIEGAPTEKFYGWGFNPNGTLVDA